MFDKQLLKPGMRIGLNHTLRTKFMSEASMARADHSDAIVLASCTQGRIKWTLDPEENRDREAP